MRREIFNIASWHEYTTGHREPRVKQWRLVLVKQWEENGRVRADELRIEEMAPGADGWQPVYRWDPDGIRVSEPDL